MLDPNTFLEIDLVDKGFTVELNPEHSFYKKAYVIVRNLLTSYERADNLWVIGYDDLDFLKNRCNEFGLVDGRIITRQAMEFYQWLLGKWQEREKVKNGSMNEHIKPLLEGKLKTPPYEDQVTAIAYAVENARVGVFDAMGVGKTLEVLGTILALGGQVKKSLIICPLNVIPGFLREVKKHTYLKAIYIPSGRTKAVDFLRNNMRGDWDLLLVHPENLIGQKEDVFGTVTKMLKSIPFDFIAVDEFHQYKNLSAKRTKCVLSLVEEVKDSRGAKSRVVLLTGTPVSESPLNAYTVLKLLSFVPNYIRFENHFCIKQNVKFGSKGEHKVITGYKNLPDLKTMVERVSIRRTKNDLRGFPDITTVYRDVFLSGEQKKLYNAIARDLLATLSPQSIQNLEGLFSTNTKGLRLRQILNHPGILGEGGDSSKYIELDGILEEVLGDKEAKVILWTEYRKAVELLHERYNDKYGSVKIYGGVDIDEDLINKFEMDPRPQIAVAIPAKAGTGTDFLARARTSIYIDRPLSYTQFSQSMDRIHRRVQITENSSKLDLIRAQPATLIFLDAVGTIDEMVRVKLEDKDRLSQALTVSDEKLIKIGRADLIQYLKALK